MHKVTLIYTISNNQDGSAGVSFHANTATAQLACDLEEEEGAPFSDNDPQTRTLIFNAQGQLLNPDADDDTPVQTFNKSAAQTGEITGTVYYVFINNGDGSASLGFYATATDAQLAADIEEDQGEAFCDHGPHAATLSFDRAGTLTNPVSDADEIQSRLNEIRGVVTPPPTAKSRKPSR